MSRHNSTKLCRGKISNFTATYYLCCDWVKLYRDIIQLDRDILSVLWLVEIILRHNWIMSCLMCRVLTQTANHNRDRLSSTSFNLIRDNSVGMWAGIQSPGEWVSQTPGFESWSHQRKATSLLSIWKSLACARASILTTKNMYICIYILIAPEPVRTVPLVLSIFIYIYTVKPLTSGPLVAGHPV